MSFKNCTVSASLTNFLCSSNFQTTRAFFSNQNVSGARHQNKTEGGVNFQTSNLFLRHTLQINAPITPKLPLKPTWISFSSPIHPQFPSIHKAIIACRASRAAMLFLTVYCLERPASVLRFVRFSVEKTNVCRRRWWMGRRPQSPATLVSTTVGFKALLDGFFAWKWSGLCNGFPSRPPHLFFHRRRRRWDNDSENIHVIAGVRA